MSEGSERAAQSALRIARKSGWGAARGPSRMDRWRLRAGWLAGALAYLSVARLSARLWAPEPVGAGWLGWLAASTLAASGAWLFAQRAARALALGAGLAAALRMGARSAWLGAGLLAAMASRAPIALTRAGLSAGSRWARSAAPESALARRLEAGRRWASQSADGGALLALSRWADGVEEKWERLSERQAMELGPLGAWELASQRVKDGLWLAAARAWELAPFDPGWEMPFRSRRLIGKGRSKARGVTMVEVCRQCEAWDCRPPAPDWRALRAALEREGLERAAGGADSGVDSEASERRKGARRL